MANFKRLPWLYLAISARIFPLVLGRDGGAEFQPSVDLGYEVRRGSMNKTGDYYIFNNIPYAQQPVGELRFSKPVPIVQSQGVPAHGHGNDDVVMCPQAYPQWLIDLMAKRIGVDKKRIASLLNNQLGQTEACLVLDVYVPANIFDEGPAANASVLVWIHGDGFTYGSKNLYDNPASLIARSQKICPQGTILSGGDVTPNLGLYDQRQALDWIQKYIVLFGGGPGRVTVMGESAGAASIVHQLTAFDGSKASPFLKAIIQSPGFQWNIDLRGNYLRTLVEASKLVGYEIDSVSQLRKLPVDLLQAINQATVTLAPMGTFGFGPGPDGSFVTDIPQKLIYKGKFDRTVQLLLSHTSHESVPFLPNITTAADLRLYVKQNMPTTSKKTVNFMLESRRLYPNVMNGTYPWRTNDTFNLVFTHPPGWYADDVPYVFFNGDTNTLHSGYKVDQGLATQLQDYIVSFAQTGNPNSVSNRPHFQKYGPNSTVLELGSQGFRIGTDDLKGERCRWLQQAMLVGIL
ncbi:alpha/beta-hydrolase [Daldinia caldariorum]|uniref:alpha/beta-hydrolase n=1 Tax=Daldinia caldariorum TaxID=326644 RepID=UPI00200769D4|nr:alpha/beta-hydrolase [Daldinia caldariorum]KAI1464806.1 alpha/beta-hydrolase [Daldinia caldariorum]